MSRGPSLHRKRFQSQGGHRIQNIPPALKVSVTGMQRGCNKMCVTARTFPPIHLSWTHWQVSLPLLPGEGGPTAGCCTSQSSHYQMVCCLPLYTRLRQENIVCVWYAKDSTRSLTHSPHTQQVGLALQSLQIRKNNYFKFLWGYFNKA